MSNTKSNTNWKEKVKWGRKHIKDFKDPLAELDNYLGVILHGQSDGDGGLVPFELDDIAPLLGAVLKGNCDKGGMLGYVTEQTHALVQRCKRIDEFMDAWAADKK